MHRKGPRLLILALIMTMALPPLPGRLFASVSSEPESSSVTRSAPVHTVAVIGDSLSIGLGKEMERAFAARQDVAFTRLGKVSSGLAKPDFFDWEKNAARLASSVEPDVVVIMIGANDNKNLATEDGRTLYFTDPAWDAAYAARASLLVDACRAHKPDAKIYWIGAPIMADAVLARDLTRINAALAGMCAGKTGCTFIDTWNMLSDGEGRFAALAAQPSGELTTIRLDDGVHVTPAGSRLLASRCLETILPAMGIDTASTSAVYADAASLRPVAARAVAQAQTQKTPSPAETAALDAPGRHTVRHGETLWAIARQAGTTVAAVTAANPGLNPDRLADGSVLALPVATETAGIQTIEIEAAPAVAAVEPSPAPAESILVAEVAPAPSAPAPAADVPAAPEATIVATEAATVAPEVPTVAVAAVETVPAEPAQVPETRTPDRDEAAVAATLAEVYTVQAGDSIWTVSKKLGVSPRLFVRANAEIDPDRLSPGQRLNVPARPVLAETAPTPETLAQAALPAADAGHVLAQGDTFWTVAKRLGVRITDLRAANPNLDPRRLQPGQRLVIPDAAPAEQAAATAPVPGQTVQGPDGATAYAVADGDTPWTLAKRFGVDVDQLLAANVGINPKRLQIGQLLTIPAPAAPDVAKGLEMRQNAEVVRVPVAKGDNLWVLARRFGLRVDDLMAVNQGIDPMRLEIGSELVIPSREAAKAERDRRDAAVEVSVRENGSVREYTVADGDTMWNLSQRFGVSVFRIIEANSGVNPDRLSIGQPLSIPASVVAARF